MEGLLLLNIPSFMGGVDLWQSQEEHDDPHGPQSMQDKVLEVVGIYSTLHLGRLQVRAAEVPVRCLCAGW